ncbi:Viral IAP-associated factor like protein [Melipona quadrifasciata]|uniref:Viral IAP-associated factor like protein n=1 Tax=Melipona quadrifasciata TaxID=166423 RepID=A0A0M9ABT7_9HYME|nr:Viral IAP-associated factor like protein [Melipona quadrifasciata]
MVILIEPLEEMLKWSLGANMKLNMDYVCMISFDVSIITISILKFMLYIGIFREQVSFGHEILKKTTTLKGILLTWSSCIISIAIGLHIYDFFEEDMADIYVWFTIMFISMPMLISIAIDALIIYQLHILKEIEGSWRMRELRQFVLLVVITIAFLTIRMPYRLARAISFLLPKASCCTAGKREGLYFMAKAYPTAFSLIYIALSNDFRDIFQVRLWNIWVKTFGTFNNPNEDTEWNDILRRKGIIPEKEKEVTEDQIISIVDNTINEKTGRAANDLENKTLDELDELEDEEDEEVLLEYRRKRIAEMKALASKSKYGEVKEILAKDYVQEVNNAGDDIWVILHLYKPGIPLCTLINQYLANLARKFPATKFLKSISTICIPNWPDRNLPTIFIYHNGNMVKQIIGAIELRGMKLTEEELEWILGQTEAIPTKITKDPKPKIRDVLFSTLRHENDDVADSNDW